MITDKLKRSLTIYGSVIIGDLIRLLLVLNINNLKFLQTIILLFVEQIKHHILHLQKRAKKNDDVLAWSIFSAVFLLVVIVIVVICICISKRRVCHERITKKRDTSMTQIPGSLN